VNVSHPAFAAAEADVKDRFRVLLAVKGKRSPDSFHKELAGSSGTSAAWRARTRA